MPFLDTNSHLTTKPYNFDIKCQGNSKSYDRHGFFGTKKRGGQNFLLTVGSFSNKREYSEADWLVPLLSLRTGLFQHLFKIIKGSMLPLLTSKKFSDAINIVIHFLINMNVLSQKIESKLIFLFLNISSNLV